MDMFGYRAIEPLSNFKEPTNHVGPIPKMIHLSPDQLVVNEDYQRTLSRTSLSNIKNMAINWDWNSYKAINVAATSDPKIFEVIDGQSTAIAAVTNGNILLLPCLLTDAQTLKEKATGFLGINKFRVSLTRAAIYYAQVAAQDEIAIGVEAALSKTGVELLAYPPSGGVFKRKQTLAISCLLDIVKKHDHDRLVRILKIAVNAEAAPISSSIIKAINVVLNNSKSEDIDRLLSTVLKAQDPNRLEDIANSRKDNRTRAYSILADIISDMCKVNKTKEFA